MNQEDMDRVQRAELMRIKAVRMAYFGHHATARYLTQQANAILRRAGVPLGAILKRGEEERSIE